MNKKTKVVIAIVTGIFLLCIFISVGGWFGLKALENDDAINDPQQAKSIAKNIIDYELPSGYQEESILNIDAMQMVIASDVASTDINTDRPLITIISIPPDINMSEEQIQSQIQKVTEDLRIPMTLVDEQKVIIKQQEVELLIYKDMEKGTAMKQIISGIFEGRSGEAMLVIVGRETNWIQSEIDTFFESIK